MRPNAWICVISSSDRATSTLRASATTSWTMKPTAMITIAAR